MIVKLALYIIILVFNKLKYGNKFAFSLTRHLKGFPEFRISSNGEVSIGKSSSFDNVRFTSEEGGSITVGKQVSFNRNCLVAAHHEIIIGDKCSFGPNVCIYDHDHKFGSTGKQAGFRLGKVHIGENCWIGANVVILRNSYIGNNSIIGAGTIVKGNIPDNSLVTSNRDFKITPLKS